MNISPTLRILQARSNVEHLRDITIYVRGGNTGDWVVRNGQLLPIPLGRRS